MKNKYLLGILSVLTIILASSVVLAYDDITISDISYPPTINPNNLLQGSFKVTNYGTTIATVSFSGLTLEDNSVRNIQINSISPIIVNSNGLQTINVDFSIPVSNNAYASTYQGTLIATSATSVDSFDLSVTVNSNLNNPTYAGGTNSASLSGTTATGAVTVINNRNQDIVVTKSGKLTSGSKTLTISSGSQTLEASSNTGVTYSISVPKSTEPGNYLGKLNLTYDSGAKKLSIPVRVIIPPQESVEVVDSLAVEIRPGDKSTKNIKVTNNGNVDLGDITLSANNIISGNEEVNLTFTPSKFNLTKGSSQTVSMKATASDEMNEGNYSHTISITAPGLSDSINLNVKVKGILEITDVDVNSDDDDEVFKPGEDMTFKIKIKNFADEIDLDEVEVKIELRDNGEDIIEDEEGDELEDDYDVGNLDSGDSETIEFDFRMPYDIDDGDDITVYIKVTAEEEDSDKEYLLEDESLIITSEKEKHEIEVFRASLDSSTLACARTTYLNVGIRNIGSNSEDVEISVISNDLGIENIDIIEDVSDDPDDDEFEVSRSYFIDAADMSPGNYPITIRVYYDDGDEKTTVSPSPSLKIERCSYGDDDDYSDSGSGNDDDDDDDVEFNYADSGDEDSTKPYTAGAPITVTDTTRRSLRGNNSYIYGLAAAAVIIILAILLLIYFLIKK